MATVLDKVAQPNNLPTAGSAAARGERLYPQFDNRLYWHLTQLRKAYEGIIQRLKVECPDGVLIDYGCGNMPYRVLFEPIVSEYIGCDFPGNELATQFVLPDGRLPLDDSTADIVLSSQVLEHVGDPDLYLAEAYRVLRSGGALALSTHGVWRYHPDPTDFWRWTCDGLRSVVERNGFTITSFCGVMGPEATAWQIWQDAVADRVNWRLQHWFRRYSQWQIERADRRCSDTVRNHDASVYVLLARK